MPIPQNFGRCQQDYSQPREAGRPHGDAATPQERRQKTHNDSLGVQTPQQRHREEVPRPSSRQELIARIKQESRPQWMRDGIGDQSSDLGRVQKPGNNSLMRPVEHSDEIQGLDSIGQSIERPRSALHRGDFRELRNTGDTRPHDAFYEQGLQGVSTSPPVPWQQSFAFSANRPNRPNSSQATTPIRPAFVQGRHRAASQSSLSSSFIFRPPTSPLVLQTNNADSDEEYRARSKSPNKSSRRRTFSPGALQSARAGLGQSLGQPPVFQREEIYPRQAHQPRRSISSLHSFSTPQTPLTRSRRASLMSEASPLQGTQMVGGYEESILRGRMSSQASKPFDFVARIGVLGRGDCKTSLRCPPHISVPFPAVFYHYGRSASGQETGPSPYVGHIDLESRETNEGSKVHNNHSQGTTRSDADGDVPMLSVNGRSAPLAPGTRQIRQFSKTSRFPPPGSYRIPQQGQLQIIIKNPHKTAVKLFLVPYDISDMQPGQRTFIRQRSYSAGPILDMPLDARKNLGTDRPEAALSNSEDPNDRPILRYLIHIQICCPSKGRFYLYRNIRVVFANRVPDGKEKLRNEVQLPQPRYSAYKPETDQSNAARPLPRARGIFNEDVSRSSIHNVRRDVAASFPSQRPHQGTTIAEATSNGSGSEDASDGLSPKTQRRPSIPARNHQLNAETLSFERRPTPEPRGRCSPSPHRRRQGGLLALQLRRSDDDCHDMTRLG